MSQSLFESLLSTTRKLSDSEQKELTKLIAEVARIVSAADLARLRETGVLGDPSRAGTDYAEFYARFRLLHAKIDELNAAGKVLVNTALDSSMGADTPINSDKKTVEIHLPPSFVKDPSNSSSSWTTRLHASLAGKLGLATEEEIPESVVERAIKLLHEVSHALSEGPAVDFLIKDYTYRGSWGQGSLRGTLGWRNADTYAEAAAQIAEDTHPGESFREKGSVRIQREVLLSALPDTVYAAMVWLDIKVNRAWLRSADCLNFASKPIGVLHQDEFNTKSAKDPDYIQKLAFERKLKALKLIGVREKQIAGLGLSISFSTADQKTMTDINGYLKRLKKKLGQIQLRLSDVGAITCVEGKGHPYPATTVLTIPLTAVSGSPFAIGNAILRVLIDGLAYPAGTGGTTALLDQNKHLIVDMLVEHDRPFESQQLSPLVASLQRSAAPPKAAAWANARIELGLAKLARMAKAVLETADTIERRIGDPDVRKALPNLHTALVPDLDDALTFPENPGALSALQSSKLKSDLSQLLGALTRIHATIAGVEGQAPPEYKDYISTLVRLTREPDPVLPVVALNAQPPTATSVTTTTALVNNTGILPTTAVQPAPALQSTSTATLPDATPKVT